MLWKPQVGLRVPPPDWTRQLEVQWDIRKKSLARFETPLRFRIFALPADAEIVFARLNGSAIPFDPQQRVLGPVTLTPEIALLGFRFRIGLRRDERTTIIDCKADVPVAGALQLRESGWKPLAHNRWISTNEARSVPCRIFIPSVWDEETGPTEPRAVLMEGAAYRSVARERTHPLGRFSGTGGPLRLQRSPYNSSEASVPLCAALINFGVVQRLQFERKRNSLRIVLHQPLVPGELHRVVLWSADSGVEVMERTTITAEVSQDFWEVPNPWEGEPTSVVAAVSFDGLRLGFGWMGRFQDQIYRLPGEAHPIEPLAHAALIRWFQLPALLETKPSETILAGFAERHPQELIAAWFFDDGLDPFGLRHDHSTDRREADRSVLRTLLIDWKPDQEATRSILTRLKVNNPKDPLTELIDTLLPHDPLLVGSMLKQVWPRRTQRERGRLQEWRGRMVGIDCVRGDQLLYQKQCEALLNAARTMRVDPRTGLHENFVKGVADTAIEAFKGERIRDSQVDDLCRDFQVDNLATALEVGSFRQYLGMRVLEELQYH